jgi:hypothetical protein
MGVFTKHGVFRAVCARQGAGEYGRPLSAGPEAQRRFFHAVLDASAAHTDPRLEPPRSALRAELARFERLTGAAG